MKAAEDADHKYAVGALHVNSSAGALSWREKKNSEPQNTQTTQNNTENMALGTTDRTACNYVL